MSIFDDPGEAPAKYVTPQPKSADDHVDSCTDSEALRREVVAQLEREQLKRDILNELKPPERRILQFAKHPAVLLIFGFILTTLAGGWLTFSWQSREWYNQQFYLARQRELDQKYAITDELTKAVGESVTAADDVLALFYWDGTQKARAIEEEETRKYWRQSSRTWRANSSSLMPKISAHFKNPEVREIFQEIVNRRVIIGNKIKNLLGVLDQSKQAALSKAEVQKEAARTLELDNNLRDDLKQLAASMVEEILEDGTPQPAPSLLQSLKRSLRPTW